jgi:hypothetical protein
VRENIWLGKSKETVNESWTMWACIGFRPYVKSIGCFKNRCKIRFFLVEISSIYARSNIGGSNIERGGINVTWNTVYICVAALWFQWKNCSGLTVLVIKVTRLLYCPKLLTPLLFFTLIFLRRVYFVKCILRYSILKSVNFIVNV